MCPGDPMLSRLELRRHQEHVGAAFDEVRAALVETDKHPHAIREHALPSRPEFAKAYRAE